MSERIDGRTLRYQHRRGELLDAVGEYVLDNGIGGMSLRRVAQDVGVSHATLQHHFGSKEQLIDEIIDHVLTRTLVPPAADVEPPTVPDAEQRLREMWAQWTSPTGLRDIRLFLEMVGHSFYDTNGYAAAMRRSMEARTRIMAAAIIAQGCPPEEAPVVATLLIGELRGLMTDLLITGDQERIDAAFELVLANSRWRVARWQQQLSG
jgi:AcrR family transcriptional regulator